MSEKTNYEAGFGSNALKDPRRIVFITPKTSAKVKADVSRRVMSYPALILRETIALQVMMIVLVILALFWDAPLEQLANPLLTPNPAKAPWYFLGLQELLHYFPPVVAGILIPTLVILALVVIPYFNVNIKGEPLWRSDHTRRFVIVIAISLTLLVFLAMFEAWTVFAPTAAAALLMFVSYFATTDRSAVMKFLGTRPVSWWVMTWFIAVSVTLTVVGTFSEARAGPGSGHGEYIDS